MKTSTTTTTALLAIATSDLFLLITPTQKSTYHSLFTSDSLSDNASISNHLKTLTRRPHVAGSEANAEASSYVVSVFASSNTPSHLVSYEVSLIYPLPRSLVLTLTSPPTTTATTFTLQQETYEGDPYADVADEVVPNFHAYAKSGTVAAPVCYVNYGRVEDYLTLKEKNGVNVSGTVVLARYGKIYRGDIVKDYGGGGEAKAKWFPDEKWLPPSGVQVGTVYDGLGDPTTPGWASSGSSGGDGECERLNKDEVEKGGDVPLVPSLPVCAADEENIMRSIVGPVAEDDWQ